MQEKQKQNLQFYKRLPVMNVTKFSQMANSKILLTVQTSRILNLMLIFFTLVQNATYSTHAKKKKNRKKKAPRSPINEMIKKKKKKVILTSEK